MAHRQMHCKAFKPHLEHLKNRPENREATSVIGLMDYRSHSPLIRIQVAAEEGNLGEWLRTLTAKLLKEYLLVQAKVRGARQEIWVSLNSANDLAQDNAKGENVHLLIVFHHLHHFWGHPIWKRGSGFSQSSRLLWQKTHKDSPPQCSAVSSSCICDRWCCSRRPTNAHCRIHSPIE